jgi:DNA mismatch endonuclease (patch repair protein)
MADRVSSAVRTRIMSSVGTKHTGPELVVRHLLFKLGYRYRLHRRDLPGSPDLAFPGRRKVIFVHGCFWHGHGCRWGQPPKSRVDYWGPKIAGNKARDRRKRMELKKAGWASISIWQCGLRSPTRTVAKLAKFLGPP